jgi:GrpB-like predicted nucleotidyltransferase (UPF0157 family)
MIKAMTKFIEPYNPIWKTEFENIRQVLEKELGDLRRQIDIQHVGSTSIPGLLAKPIIDIDIIIENKDLITVLERRLEKIGYISKGEQGIAGRFAFRQTSDFAPLTATKNKWPSHHLYVCYADSLALKNHIMFRDILRKNKELLVEYSNLKRV